MDVTQVVSDVGNIDVTGNRRFNTRSISSRVAVRSGESWCWGRSRKMRPTTRAALVAQGAFEDPVRHHEQEARPHRITGDPTPKALYNDEELRQTSEEMREWIRDFDLIGTRPVFMLVKIVAFQNKTVFETSSLWKSAFVG